MPSAGPGCIGGGVTGGFPAGLVRGARSRPGRSSRRLSSPRPVRARPTNWVVTEAATGRSSSSMRFWSSSAGARGGSTATTVMPSMPNSVSALTTSPVLAPWYSNDASKEPRGSRAPAARQVQVPSDRALVSSISKRRATALRYSFGGAGQIQFRANGHRTGSASQTPPAASFGRVSLPIGERNDVCAWCGARLPQPLGAGRPRRYCRRSCRQRDFEARKRARELGIAESDLIVARKSVEGLDDLLFVLACAISDVEGDLALDGSSGQLRRSLDWLLEAARPLVGASQRLRGTGS